uniref:G protein-coupled receptor n=1 Tax=Panagrellus redivivus TaxID=6233 RepID=A0A7E4UTE7_PANRE
MAKNWNCDNRTHEEWVALGRPNWQIGALYIVSATFFLIFYIPALWALAHSELLKYSAYKFMFLLGVVDIFGLINAGYICGYSAIVGMIYCMAPTFNYIAGIWAFTCWTTSSSTCVLLALTRCIDMFDTSFGRSIFGGKKTFIWFIIPAFYMFWFIFIAGSCVFNSNIYAYSFDPFFGTPERNGVMDVENYPHMSLALHNISVSIILSSIYALLCLVLGLQTKGVTSVKLGKIQRNTLIQAALICCTVLAAALLYSYMNFFPVGPVFVIVAEMSWLCSHGVPGLLYIFFNASIRRDVIDMFCKSTSVKPSAATTTTNRGVTTTSSSDVY